MSVVLRGREEGREGEREGEKRKVGVERRYVDVEESGMVKQQWRKEGGKGRRGGKPPPWKTGRIRRGREGMQRHKY